MVECELQRVPPVLARRARCTSRLWSIVYLPQVGYVIKVNGPQLEGEWGHLGGSTCLLGALGGGGEEKIGRGRGLRGEGWGSSMHDPGFLCGWATVRTDVTWALCGSLARLNPASELKHFA